MKLSLLVLSVVVADFIPAASGTTSAGNPASCPKITCVMFCTDGLQKDEKGCDKCSCVRGAGKVASGTASCKRDANGCCSELGMAWCPEQSFCLSTRADAVIPCKSWSKNPPATGAATVSVSGSFGSVPAFGAPVTATSNIAISSQSGYSGSLGQTSSSTRTPATNGAASASALSVGVTSSSCPEVMCALYCPSGFKKDSRGCNTCACAGSSNGQCASVDCGGSTCAGGFSKDSNGCPTCICLAGATAPALAQTTRPVASSSSVGRLSASTGSGANSDTLVAVDRPRVALNPCLPSPCRSSQRCVPSPKQCIQAPCPQYTCVRMGKN